MSDREESNSQTESESEEEQTSTTGKRPPRPTGLGPKTIAMGTMSVDAARRLAAKVPVVAPTGVGLKVWTDRVAYDSPRPVAPHLPVATIITLGQQMVLMLTAGPTTHLAPVVYHLALNLRHPEVAGRVFDDHLFDEEETTSDIVHPIRGNAGVISLVNGVTQFMDREGQRVGEAALTPIMTRLMDIETFVQEHPGRPAEVYRDLFRFFTAAGDMDQEAQAKMYCLIAAILCRVCAKRTEAVAAHLKAMREKIGNFYEGYSPDADLPAVRVEALNSLAIILKPGASITKQILRTFLMQRYYTKEPDTNLQGLLDYSLLLHCSYNGLQMPNLVMNAAIIAGDDTLSHLITILMNDEMAKSWTILMEYFGAYTKAGKAGNGKLAPWCRLFSNEYWSNLNAKRHPILAAGLMEICSVRNPTIFDMVNFDKTDHAVLLVRAAVQSYLEERAKTRLTKGATPGSIFHGMDPGNLVIDDPQEDRESEGLGIFDV